MAEPVGKVRQEAGEIIQAEKGERLTPRNLHLRLRVVEVVVLISLLLNLLHWYIAGANDRKIQDQVNAVSAQTSGEVR